MKKFKRKERVNSTLLFLANWVAPRATGDYIAKLFLTPNRFERPEWERNLLDSAKRIDLTSGRKAHLAEFSRALGEDIQELGNFAAIVAHSMGAAALMLATEQGLKVGKAILIASPSQWMPAMQTLARRFRLRDATLKAVLKSIEKTVGQPMDDFDVHKWKNVHDTAMLILHDEKDRDVPTSEFSRLKEAYPQVRGKLFSGLGHRKILKDPDVISEVLSFIKEAP